MPFTEIRDFEDKPDIILIFHGLMAVWEDKTPKSLNFGCHSAADKPHKLEIQIGNHSNNLFNIESKINSFEANTDFEFYIEGTRTEPTIGIYHNGKAPNPMRNFDNVISIEKLHGTDIWRENPSFSHLIKVKNGVLYTKEYTPSTFDLYNDERYEFSDKMVASELGINLSLDEGQVGVLKFGKDFIRFAKGERTPHVIRFTNECNYDWKPEGEETERNDFYLNYDNLIDMSKIDNKYRLYLKTPSESDLVSTYGPRSVKPSASKKYQSSRNSPCTAQGYPPRRN